MRTRSVIEIQVHKVDAVDSELHLITDDGEQHGLRSIRSAHATIDHAAARLAAHYGLVRSGPGRWSSRTRTSVGAA